VYILLSLLLFLAQIVVVIAMSPSRVVNVIHLFGRIVFVTPLFRGSSTCYAFRVCGVHGGGVGFLFPIGLKGDGLGGIRQVGPGEIRRVLPILRMC
jgi:hypothetical protein